MIIRHNEAGTGAIRVLNARQGNIRKTISQLSTGERIVTAGDDPASFTVSEKLRGKISGLTAAKQNAVDGLSLVQTTEGYLGSVQSLLSTAKSLAVQSANGVYSDQDRANIQLEFAQILKELDRVEGAAQFNGRDLLKGNFANQEVLAVDSAGSAVTEAPTDEGVTSEALTLQVGVNPNDTIDIFINAFNTDKLSLRELLMDSTKGARQAIQFIDKAIDDTNKQLVELGSYAVRLNNVISSSEIALENFKTAESNIRNANIAEAVSKLSSELISDQVNVAMVSQANVQAQSVLRLF